MRLRGGMGVAAEKRCWLRFSSVSEGHAAIASIWRAVARASHAPDAPGEAE